MSNLGKQAEDLAAEYYRQQGYQLVERNYFPRFGKRMGELDLICRKDQELVFVEVKARHSQRFGTALEAVDWFKQQKLVRTVKLYLRGHPQYARHNYRIDVAIVDIDNYPEPVIIFPNAIEDLD